MFDLQQVVSFHMQQLMTTIAIAELLLAIPIGFILKRLGFNPLWAVLTFVPAVGVPALWLLAFIGWPQRAQTAP
jgi:hypothetical protein